LLSTEQGAVISKYTTRGWTSGTSIFGGMFYYTRILRETEMMSAELGKQIVKTPQESDPLSRVRDVEIPVIKGYRKPTSLVMIRKYAAHRRTSSTPDSGLLASAADGVRSWARHNDWLGYVSVTQRQRAESQSQSLVRLLVCRI
jgi:hypothetical protein